MKKKLLITLGCSFTEGVGAYDLNKIPSVHRPNNIGNDFVVERYKLYRPRFHMHSWSRYLQKSLNYDVLINLGLGGSSDSNAIKRFIEVFDENSLSENYDVLVVWGLTFPERISFYKDGKNVSILPGYKHGDTNHYSLGVSYNNFTQNNILDHFLEQIFHVKTMRNLCNRYSFNFLYFSMFNFKTNIPTNLAELHTKYFSHDEYLNSYLPDSNFLLKNNEYKNISDADITTMDKFKRFFPSVEEMFRVGMLSPVCGHPNEYGYRFLSHRLFSIIEQKFPQYVNHNTPDFFSSLYWGEPSTWVGILPYQQTIK
jgi:hypothetical protein